MTAARGPALDEVMLCESLCRTRHLCDCLGCLGQGIQGPFMCLLHYEPLAVCVDAHFSSFFFFFSGSRSLVYCDGLKGGCEVWLKMAGSGAEQKIWEASLLL